MVLPAPDLDDRTFQQLVDDAKRMVQQRCPTWTDHNVSDPGVTLIEAFAQMVDQLIYRLNRVPERHYVKFLDLIGVELRPPAAARGRVTFWLSAPQPQPVLVRAETEVATPRTDVADPVVFATNADLTIVPCSFSRAAAVPAGGEAVDHTVALRSGQPFDCFQRAPQAGDALLVGLSAAVPSCAVVVRMDCRVRGVGVRPDWPPLVWEAWTGASWTACELDRDETGGLNRAGDVVLHVPETHVASIVARQRAGWLRCRLLPPEEGQPTYRESPQVLSLSAFTIGGTARTIHAQVVRREDVGLSDGTPAQRFSLQRRPVVPWEEPSVLEVHDGTDTQEWTAVEHFADSGPGHRHFHLDAAAGEVQFGPAVRESDGTLRHYGAVPPKGASLRIRAYRTGGGVSGNVGTGQIRVLKTSVPYVARVENRSPAIGGARGEDIEDAKQRGPLVLRSRGRAVTAEDFEELTRQVAPEIARVQCAPDAGGVRVLVVPWVEGDDIGRIRREHLDPLPESLARVTAHLDERRLIGTRLVVEPPAYRWLTAVVSVRARPRFQAEDVRTQVLRAVYRLFDPLHGGPEGTGWPLGRAVQPHEVNAILARIPGVDMSEEIMVQLFPADPDTGRRGAAVPRLALAPGELVHSYEHQVQVRR
ncbi:putative baseplate assembly protein [Nakamurella deserti]|uniref:putative baseplate assembly protein n=1 Tax=Nakamurella deserti TaxID=2164074 RepID=UPI000DBE43D7|nr:putative baseplate assembly protein [Nakamurella deserti]